MLPAYAVVALGARRDLIAALSADLLDQVCEVVLVDNRPDLGRPILPGSVRWIDNPDPVVHAAFNLGLHTARRLARASGAERWAALVVNDDVRIGAGAVARLVAPLDHDPSIWATYPDLRGMTTPSQPVAETGGREITGRSHTGWCVCHRGEAGLRYDEGYGFWFGDDQYELDVRALGGRVAAVHGVPVRHLQPDAAVRASAALRAIAAADRRRFIAANPATPLARAADLRESP